MLKQYLIIIYLQFLKFILRFKKYLYLILLNIRKNIFLYHLTLRLSTPFSWYKRIALLEFNKRHEKVLELCFKRLEQHQEPYLYEIIVRNLRYLNRIEEAL